MLGVLFNLIVKQPKLLLSHATNYAHLLVEELQYAFITWKILLLLYVLSAACLGLALVATVVSVLLWCALPMVNPHTEWVLVALPLALLLSSVLLYAAGKRFRVASCFTGIQEQINLDILALSEIQNP